ncbi:Txe/YoeB family addiction module toxin [Microbacterium sp.]|uniref:Txe/YoeB family addiction module toxin n=1 Tax=Microbacterium sp. TaxID=51671 RepID=UPI003C78B44E
MKKLWSDQAWDDYLAWQAQDRKTLKRINLLIKEIERAGKDRPSIGKAERLKHSDHGLLSVRIDARNRLVYAFMDGELYIVSRAGHYE